MELNRESCEPCPSGAPALSQSQTAELLSQVPDWRLGDDGHSIRRRFTFVDFKQAMAFVNRMADLAEVEGHHPDFFVQSQLVDVALSTHDVGGLSRNDFILAAKIESIIESIADQLGTLS